MVAPKESLGRVIVIGNLKGGTGKSTVTVNLAGALCSLGRQVAIVDTDPQGTTYEWILRGKLDMLCLHRPLQRMEESGDWIKVTTNLREGHEIVFVDLPSVVAPALAAAYFIADLILIPASPSGVDASGTRRALRYVELARAERRENPPKVLVVPSRVPDFGPEWDRVENLLETLGEELAPPLRFLPAYDQAFRSGQWVGNVAPNSPAEADVIALAKVTLEALGLEQPETAPKTASEPASTATKAPTLVVTAAPPAASTEQTAGAGAKRIMATTAPAQKAKPAEVGIIRRPTAPVSSEDTPSKPAAVAVAMPKVDIARSNRSVQAQTEPPAGWWGKILGRKAKRF